MKKTNSKKIMLMAMGGAVLTTAIPTATIASYASTDNNQVSNAESVVKMAESLMIPSYTNNAKSLVNSLPGSQTKTSLLQRLNNLDFSIQRSIIEDGIESYHNYSSSKMESLITSKISKLPNTSQKANLTASWEKTKDEIAVRKFNDRYKMMGFEPDDLTLKSLKNIASQEFKNPSLKEKYKKLADEAESQIYFQAFDNLFDSGYNAISPIYENELKSILSKIKNPSLKSKATKMFADYQKDLRDYKKDINDGLKKSTASVTNKSDFEALVIAQLSELGDDAYFADLAPVKSNIKKIKDAGKRDNYTKQLDAIEKKAIQELKSSLPGRDGASLKYRINISQELLKYAKSVPSEYQSIQSEISKDKSDYVKSILNNKLDALRMGDVIDEGFLSELIQSAKEADKATNSKESESKRATAVDTFLSEVIKGNISSFMVQDLDNDFINRIKSDIQLVSNSSTKNALQKSLDEKIDKSKVNEAEAYVSAVNKTKYVGDLNYAKSLVGKLANGTQKTSLTNMLNSYAGTINKPAPKPVVKPAPKPVVKPAPKPVTKPAPKPVAKPAPKPVAKPAPKPVAKPAPKPVVKKSSTTKTTVKTSVTTKK